MRDAPSISIIILTCRRPRLLKICLDSVLAAELSEVCEVMVVINGEDPEPLALAAAAAAREPRVRVEILPRSSRGRARNLAAARARGSILHFLDDDVTVPPEIFTRTARRFQEHPEAAAVGGPNLTPDDASAFERAVGWVLATRLGAWTMRARYAPVGRARWAGEESLMLCSLALRADADGPGGLRFPEELASAEENLLLERVRAHGGRLFYDPDLSVRHRRRGDWRGFASQTFKSGAGRLQAVVSLPSCLKPEHLAPAAFALYLAALPLGAHGPWVWAPLGLYLALLAWECAVYARQEDWRAAGLLALLVPLNHLAYAAGFLLGPFFWAEAESGS